MAARHQKIHIRCTARCPALPWTTRLELEGDSLRVTGRYEYVMGFGHHYQAQPAVVMRKTSALFDIQMTVTNPLQSPCRYSTCAT